VWIFVSLRREEHRVKVYENRVLRRTFRPKRETARHCTVRSFITSTLQILLG